MLATVIVVVATHDLAKGVLVGVLLSGFFFAHKVGMLLHVGWKSEDEGRMRSYRVVGQVFFASSGRFIGSFDFKEVIEKVRIDVSRAHFWDITAVNALDKVILKFRREGTEVEVVGLNKASATLIDRFALHDKPDAIEQMMGH
jgi:SulP family sulfate permease